MRMFQAVSLETDADDAKLLAYSAPGLVEGVRLVNQAELELTAIVEPIQQAAGDSEDRRAQYEFALEVMTDRRIRVLTSSVLPEVAETARRELHV
jgi:hypothetical protein